MSRERQPSAGHGPGPGEYSITDPEGVGLTQEERLARLETSLAIVKAGQHAIQKSLTDLEDRIFELMLRLAGDRPSTVYAIKASQERRHSTTPGASSAPPIKAASREFQRAAAMALAAAIAAATAGITSTIVQSCDRTPAHSPMATPAPSR